MSKDFNFEEIKNKALEQLKYGKSLLGKDGAFAPLLERILNAALEGERVLIICFQMPSNSPRMAEASVCLFSIVKKRDCWISVFQIQEAESRNKIFHISSSAFSSLHIPAIRKVQVSDFIWSRLIRNFMAVTSTESPRTKEKELPLA